MTACQTCRPTETSLRAGVLEQEHCAQQSAHLVGLIVYGVGQKIDSFAATCLGPD